MHLRLGGGRDRASDDARFKSDIHQEVARLPAEPLRLEMDLHNRGIDQDWGDAAHEKLREPVGPDVLLEEGARAA